MTEQKVGAIGESINDGPTEKPSTWSLAITTIGIMLVFFMLTLEHYMMAAVVPTIAGGFRAYNDAAWYSAGYYLTNMAILPVYGQLYAEFPVKRVFSLAIMVFLAGSTVCAIAHTSVMLIIGRLVCGLGGGGIYVGSIIITGLVIPLKHRALYIAFLSMVDGASAVAGPLLGGYLADTNWRWLFYINIILSSLSVTVSSLLFTDFPKPGQERVPSLLERFATTDWLSIILVVGGLHMDRKDSIRLLIWSLYKGASDQNARPQKQMLKRLATVDWISLGFLIFGFGLLMFSLQKGGTKYPWSHWKIWGGLIGAGALLSSYLVFQRILGEKAAIPYRVLRQRTVFASAVFITCIAMATAVLVYFLPYYFQGVRDLSGWVSGRLTLSFMMPLLLTPLLSGLIISWTGHHIPLMLLGSSLATVGCGMMTTVGVSTPLSTVIGWEFLTGFGIGFCNQIPFATVQGTVAKEDIFRGSTLCALLNSMGSMLGIVGAQLILTTLSIAQLAKMPFVGTSAAYTVGPSPEYMEQLVADAHKGDIRRVYASALQETMLLPLVLCMLCVFCCLFMKWTRLDR